MKFPSVDINFKLFIEMSTLQPMTYRELAPMVSARGAAWSISRLWARSRSVREGKLLALLGGEGC